MKTSKVPQSWCDTCGLELDAASDMFTERAPSPGDVSICINCGTAYVFDENLNLSKPSPEIQEIIDQDENVIILRQGMRACKSKLN